ncbi:ribbon-helix-helix protein, CopG family [Nocardia suismassiliense]|uniref:ribbon-helix-helix protein, CopG family n=1 Tax=Nocardia suismassiliense TaxID=2077092 RepID=UPI00131F196D|nr:ribbon-helix-helix protein, CopG family [Nocardia suismassiliense]
MGDNDFPATPQGVDELMDSLVFDDAPVREADVPPPMTPGEDIMVVRSLRLPLDMDQSIKAEAQARGISMSELIRDWLAVELAALADDQPISRADALRALAGVRPIHPRAS